MVDSHEISHGYHKLMRVTVF